MRPAPTCRLLAAILSLALIAVGCGGDDDAATTADGGDDAATTVDGGADAADDAADDTADDAAADDAPGDDAAADDAAMEDPDQLTSEGEGRTDGDLTPVSGGEVTWGLTNDGTGFDTTGAIAPGAIRIIGALTDTLVAGTPGGGWAPNLAESLTPNEDFTVWTITMRPGLTFHDGEPVDADALVANLEAFRTGPVSGFAFTAVDEIVAVDELSAEVRMNTPWGAFPYILIGQPGWLVSPSTIGTNETFVSTGPFMLESWTPGDGARAVRNPNYWREGLPYLDAINFKFIPEQTVKRQALEAGDIDGYISPGDEDILDFLEDDGVDVWIGEASANEHLYILNTAVAPTDDIRVRRGLAHAIDRDLIIDTFRSGLTEKASSSQAPGSPFHHETDYPDYDPELAAELIAEYEAEVEPVQFSVKLEPNPSVREVVELVVSFWEDAGAEVEIVEIGGGQSALTAISDDFQAFSWFQFSGIDPDGDYPFFHSAGGTNILNWSNLVSDKIDEGLDIGRANADPELRAPGYAMFQEALAEELPMLWIDHLNGVEAAVTRPELHGIGPDDVLPDGGPALGMIAGSFFSWYDVWLEQ